MYGIAVLSTSDVLLATGGETRIHKLTFTTGKLTDTAYDMAPLFPTTIHINSDNKVFIGGNNSKQGRRAVCVMNEQGKHETVFELDQHNQPIFTNPRSITSTRNGIIHVVDCSESQRRE